MSEFKLPSIQSKNPGSLKIDNYIISELFLREDFPEYFTEEERTYEAIVEFARLEKERDYKRLGIDDD